MRCLAGACDTERMTDEPVDQLAEVSDAAGECPECGQKPVRVATRYPGQATVVCENSHQWEVKIAD